MRAFNCAREKHVNKLIHRRDRLAEREQLATGDVKRALNLRQAYAKFTSHGLLA